MAELRSAFLALAVLVVLLVLGDRVFLKILPETPRLSPNFSAAYLDRKLAQSRGGNPCIVFGDSVLWGYRLSASENLTAVLERAGLPCKNLAFEGGSIPNTYLMLRLALQAGIRPRLVIFNVNQKQFNPLDSAYDALHPALRGPAQGLLSDAQRERLRVNAPSPSVEQRLDRVISTYWAFYAMRNDVREIVFNDLDAAHALQSSLHRLTGAKETPKKPSLEGVYDLTPLADDNVGVHFLHDLCSLIEREHIRAIAILTPVNHRLVHEFVDTPVYRENVAATQRVLAASGITVVDADTVIESRYFIDNDHLTSDGQAQLAALVLRAAKQ